MTRPTPISCFADSYADARTGFLEACAPFAADLASRRHPLPGPDGAPLFLDVARFGAPDARRVLFVSSGTHGVEGFCGSGIQRFLLEDGVARRLPADLALVLVHAVNPWGFAWLRRVNEDNVDVNRNFLDHEAPHPENPEYDALYAVVNPTQLDDAAVAATLEAVSALQRERGSAAVYRALSGGQYQHADGLQYGGRAPVWSNRTLRSVWARHAAGAELAVHVDLHSGLGPYGVGLVLQTAREAALDGRLARAWWPEVIRAEPGEGSDAALVSGLVGPAFCAAQKGAAVAMVLEFGTRDMIEVMGAVQADNWLHHHGQRASDRGREISQRMRDAFYPDQDDWKEKVCVRAGDVIARAIAGMADFGPESRS